MFRGGCNYGSKAYFPKIGKNGSDVNEDEVMQAFICQFYNKNEPASIIMVNQYPKEKELVEELLSKKVNHKVKIEYPKQGKKLDIINLVLKNANESLNRKIFEKSSNKNNLKKLQEIFSFKNSINKVEVYDNSHHQGKSPIGAMIAFNEDGFSKSMYRRYNIKTDYKKHISISDDEITNNNDYLMMQEVMKTTIHWEKYVLNFPDLLIIDGGKGHLNTVLSVLKQLKIR